MGEGMEREASLPPGPLSSHADASNRHRRPGNPSPRLHQKYSNYLSLPASHRLHWSAATGGRGAGVGGGGGREAADDDGGDGAGEGAREGAGEGVQGGRRGRKVTRVGGPARTYRINTQYLATQHKRQLVAVAVAMAGSAVGEGERGGGAKVVFIL